MVEPWLDRGALMRPWDWSCWSAYLGVRAGAGWGVAGGKFRWLEERATGEGSLGGQAGTLIGVVAGCSEAHGIRRTGGERERERERESKDEVSLASADPAVEARY